MFIRSSRRPVSVGRSTRKPVLVPPLMHGFSSSYQTDSLSLSSPVERSHMTKQEAAEKELEIKNFFLASEKLRYFDKMVFNIYIFNRLSYWFYLIHFKI